MKRILLFIIVSTVFTGDLVAAVRGADAGVRSTLQTNSRNTSGTPARGNASVRTSSTTNSRTASTTRGIQSRTASSTRGTQKSIIGRNAVSGIVNNKTRIPRTATTKKTRISRAATTTGALTNTFGADYNKCHDAYFACMDQFCANQDDSYRRCVCSSKLETIKSRQRILEQTGTQLQDFKDLNIESILKTPAEVNAMLTASEGESTLENAKDNSESAQKLENITNVLNNTRSKAMSTSGRLDIAGDIKEVWATTNLTAGANIANLTGESLYNAVHTQCAELISDQCASKSTLDMVISAYGMYIENDCTIILSQLDKELTNANVSIRETGNEMKTARLENYNAHNSATINECIAKVREKLTEDVACGENYVHCLDVTNQYLERATGAPIYSSSFYELANQTSLSGNVLTNKTNSKLITELNSKKQLALSSLETCRDVADEVWDEFLRQAITEIYQGQQSKIRQVKDECLDVVNKCYDEKTNQLRDFSNIDKQFLLGAQLELSEEMCQEKLNTCSNLYGGGADGLRLLLTEMRDITSRQISQNCATALKKYSEELCKSPNRDTQHPYPYACRMYAPGSTLDSTSSACISLANVSVTPEYSSPVYRLTDNEGCDGYYESSDSNNGITITGLDNLPRERNGCRINYSNSSTSNIPPLVFMHMCYVNRHYTHCNNDYFLLNHKCYPCPEGQTCANDQINGCDAEFADSLYQKLISYANEYCVRPSVKSDSVSISIIADINSVMDEIRADMSSALASECERQGGKWDAVPKHDNGSTRTEHKEFYETTNAHKGWGTCLMIPVSTNN